MSTVEQADALHAQAAALNKEGRFAGAAAFDACLRLLTRSPEANVYYAKYRAAMLEADGQAAADVGAIATRLAEAAAAAPVRTGCRLGPGVRERAVAAVVAAAVSDAAAMPLHWVYDLSKLKVLVGDGPAAFVSPAADAFYSYPVGSASPYGEQAAALLRSLVDARGFSPEAYAVSTFATFGAPGHSGYIDASTAGFLRAVRAGVDWPACGAEDAQANCVARLPPLVALLAGDAQLLPAVAQMVRVTQATDNAVAYGCAGARILEGVILGADPAEAVQRAITALRDPLRAFPLEGDGVVADALDAAVALAGASHADAVAQLGRNCHLPGALASPVHACLNTLPSLEAAVAATILQGGCNASRASFVGAVFGAARGLEGIPQEWRAKHTDYEKTLALADTVLSLRD